MKKRKLNFSNFDRTKALKFLGIEQLQQWTLTPDNTAPSSFFAQRLARLQETFDLTTSEKAKELIVDAFCEEAITHYPQFRWWKGAALSSDRLTGIVDYLLAPRRAYIDTPVLCVVEAKKDNFDQGQAQCWVEMHACQWRNAQAGAGTLLPVYGIVTNGDVWRFYCLDEKGQLFESIAYTYFQQESLLGMLHHLLGLCLLSLMTQA